MNDIVLKDISPDLQQRIEQVAERKGWGLAEALGHLLEAGLHAHGALPALDGSESEALVRAIAALERLPNAPGELAAIGRPGKF